MFKSLLVVMLSLFAISAFADTDEEMYKNSYMVMCEGYVCQDLRNNEWFPVADTEEPQYGYVLHFTKDYTDVEVLKATPYILERLRGEQ
jgi:hypothetical protein